GERPPPGPSGRESVYESRAGGPRAAESDRIDQPARAVYHPAAGNVGRPSPRPDELPLDVHADEVRPRGEQPAEDRPGPLDRLRPERLDQFPHPGDAEAGPREHRLGRAVEVRPEDD